MKKMIKTSLLVGMMSLPILSYGTGGESLVKIEVSGTKKFKLVLNNISYAIKVQIKDQKGYVLYKDKLKGANSYLKNYDLGTLPVGTYFLELEDETKVKIHEIEVTIDEIAILKKRSAEVFKPVVRQRGAKVDVTLFSINQTPLKVVVYNNDNEAVIQETLEGKLSLGKTYDLTKLEKGNYYFYLKNEGRKYSKKVTIK